MISPYEVKEVEFTYRCRIAAYSEETLKSIHATLVKSVDEELQKCLCNMALLSPSESRMEIIHNGI